MQKVSVCIPVYNRPEVRETIESVLSQTYRDFEVIVLDDGSSDGSTWEVISSYGEPVRAFRQDNAGIAGAKNACVAKARGMLIAFCDHDDLWLPNKLERQVVIFDEQPEVGFVYSKYSLFSSDRGDLKIRPRKGPEGDIFQAMLSKIFVQTSTAMIRRAVWEAAGPFDPSYLLADDYDFFLRVGRVTQAAFVKERLVRYRLHPDNTSRAERAPERYNEEILRIYHSWLPCGDLSQAERRIVSRRIGKYYFNLAQITRNLGKTERCWAMLANARQFDPFRFRYIKLAVNEWIRRILGS
jgi:glycosyltransferase involved in cell wall biosynthesis